MAIRFTKFTGGIKIYDSTDDSVVSLVDPGPMKITAFRSRNIVEISTAGFNKVFSAADVIEIVDNGVPVIIGSNTAETVVDLLRDSIFYQVSIVTSSAQSGTTTSTVVTLVTGSNISAGQVVSIASDGTVIPYNIYDESYAGTLAGIAIQSALIDKQVEICIQGIANVPGIGWTAGTEYFIGPNALLTQNAPTVPSISQSVAIGLSQDTVLVSLTPGIILT